jgi:pyruvate dehydrogenase E2 component (dihydrolipoyllysine-residue acetyltransferase)
MAMSVVMPALEMAQETGKLLAWRKKEGESVAKGEPLLEIETDKAVVEVEAPGDGILAGISADVGAVIPVGETIAWLVAPGEKPPSKAAASAPAARATSSVTQRVAATTAAVAAKAAIPPPQISPKARRLAKELGIDFALVRGTGPDGVITAEDIQKFANSNVGVPAPPAAAAAPTTEALSQVARLMAERTTQSWTSVPHFFLVREVDATKLVAALKRLGDEAEKTQSAMPTITDLLIALIARTLAKYPRMNASWTGEGIRSSADINISVAVAVNDGVVGAVIHNANTLKIAEIPTQRRELTERARAGRLRPVDIAGGTFTLSNLGMYKVDAFSAIITPPQAAVLAVGAISERVVAMEGKPVVRPMMTMTLSCDHRVVDGARAAEFLRDLADAIRDPGKLL